MSSYETIYAKAQELAQEIATSPEMRQMKESELAVMLDMDAREIIEEFQQIQVDAVNKGIGYEDLPEEQKKRLDELEEKMNENEVISEYMNRTQEFNQILESINMIIGNAISGNEASGCDGCSSASNCDIVGCGGSC